MAAKVKEKVIEKDFDEDMLFAEFDCKDQQKSTKSCSKDLASNECAKDARIEDLKQENSFLKAALRKLLQSKACERQTCSLPSFQAIFFDNRESRARKTKIESVLHDLSTTNNERQEETFIENERAELQSSVTELNLLLKDRENSSEVNGFSNGTGELANCDVTVISSVKYFDIFCIDCFGFPLNDFNTRLTEGWSIPVYDQVFRKALPCSEETPKIKVKFMKKCFNCDSTTHNLQNCPEPQDISKINANRSQFTSNQQKPFLPKSRYHGNLSSRNFLNFKPGFISDKLRDALDLKPDELPPYIYQMRVLGYPPGYLPHNQQPDLLLYDAEGNIDTYMGEDLNGSDFNDAKQVFVEYPGLNVPVPEGVKDHHNPPMQHHQQLANMIQIYHMTMGRGKLNDYNNSLKPAQKRKMQELERDEKDMDIDSGALESSSFESGTPAIEEPSSKRGKYNIDMEENDGRYSPTHPSLHFGEAEKSLMNLYRHAAHEKETSSLESPRANLPPLPSETPPKTCERPPLPAQTPPGTCRPPLPLETPPSTFAPLPEGTPPYTLHQATKGVEETASYFATPVLPVKCGKTRKCQRTNLELEDGEIQSDEELSIEEEEELEMEGEEEPQEKYHTGWWLKEPLSQCRIKPLKGLSPPPQPRIKLPMEALSRFYTSSTVLQKLSFEDRILWLDPVFGNLQLVSGRYEKLKEILRKIPKKSSKR